MNIQFKTPHQYVFIHENVKHLLLIWSKEAKKQLFIVEEKEGELHLLYPGETYEELVLDQVEDIFFRAWKQSLRPFRQSWELPSITKGS